MTSQLHKWLRWFSLSLSQLGSWAPNLKGFTPWGGGVTQRGALDLNFVNFRRNLRGCLPSRNPSGVSFNFTENQGTCQQGLGL